MYSRSQEWWDQWFLDLAKKVASASKDPSTKVGAVITHGKRLVSIGYNGFAEGVDDRPEYLNDRDIRIQKTVHAEANAILFGDKDLSECTLYTWPFPPCAGCAGLIINKRIKRIVSPKGHPELVERWQKSIASAKADFANAGIEQVEVELDS